MIRVLGDSFCDIMASDMTSLPKVGGDVLANIAMCAGGSGLNSTVHGAHFADVKGLDVRFQLLTALGNDFQGEVCMSALRHDRILPVVSRNHGYSTGTCIVLSGVYDRSFVTDRGCVNEMCVEWFGDSLKSFDGVDHLHVAGYFNCANLKPQLPRLFQEARGNGLSTSLNPQYDASERWTGIKEIAPFVTLFICNELELVACATASESGCPTTAASAVESKSSMSVQEAASLLIDWGCECVVATRGALGASIFIRDKSSEKRFIEISEPAVELLHSIVDSTGAGDSFCGAFLAQWIHSGRDFKVALRCGLLAGATCVSVKGASVKPPVELYNQLEAIQQKG